ncbi:divergent polysaccharide deacetylase family protein [Rhizobium sp. TRM95111]|uniref:divergent polysaccharide deacetylase family protein n=1 Tax=Rhizobium alarense TaxID=2846851 RepID=UPI001F2573BB|nr:divergent polysaccharide deacetylase family protein [Rhizobium alarense]MCF3641350.1 divergent polysaccharide deacetylase family protein [Rhizobium alarense]
MGTDINAPLGQNRKARSPAAGVARFSAGRLAFGLVGAGVLSLSVFTALAPSGLSDSPTGVAAEPAASADADVALTAQETGRDGVRRSSGTAGAVIEETRTDDGSIVRKYSPGERDGDGPLIIDASRIGQDPRAAAFPNEALLEETEFGRLPVVGVDGLKPYEQYARPWSGARGTRVAIVVGGLGLSQTGTQRAIETLPGEVTLAFASAGNSLTRWMQEARRGGHEILLQVPFEPFGYPANDPGPNTLQVDASATENLADLHRAMGRFTNYTGIMNFMGGRFLSDADAMEPVFRDIGERGLLFLDDGTAAQSLSATLAGTFSMPHAFADIQLDAELSREAVLRKLDDLERIARRNGTAIGVASAFDESVEAIAEWSGEAAKRGVEIVGVAALAAQ